MDNRTARVQQIRRSNAATAIPSRKVRKETSRNGSKRAAINREMKG